MFLDLAWLLLAFSVGYYVFGRGLKKKQRGSSSMWCAIISLLGGFNLLANARIASPYSERALIGLVVLCISWGARFLFARKEEEYPE